MCGRFCFQEDIMTSVPGPGRVDTFNGVQIYFEVHGSGEPLVLLHGFGGFGVLAGLGELFLNRPPLQRVTFIARQKRGWMGPLALLDQTSQNRRIGTSWQCEILCLACLQTPELLVASKLS
jgi:hypothetical protein